MSAKLIQTLIRRLLTMNFYVVAFGRGCTTDVTPEDWGECWVHAYTQTTSFLCSTSLFLCYLLLGCTYCSHSPTWIHLFHRCHCLVLCTIGTSYACTGTCYYRWQKGQHTTTDQVLYYCAPYNKLFSQGKVLAFFLHCIWRNLCVRKIIPVQMHLWEKSFFYVD